jgi:hypothetical protein
MKKRMFVLGFLVVSVLVFFSTAMCAEFWGSKNSNKYHYPNCKWAQKINPQNLIKFNSPEDATKAGYIPCKVCKPPLSSTSELIMSPTVSLAQAASENKDQTPQRRGCCSWHGGVCGCENGHAVCCDGTLSPSCGCD